MRSIVWPRTLLVLSAVAAGCGSTPAGPTAFFDVRAVLAIGQTVAPGGSGVSVRFDDVTADSRCPSDAVCIRAGEAIVQLTVVADNRVHVSALQTDPASDRVVTVGGIRVELIALAPYPTTAAPIGKSEYRATLRLQR